MIAKLDNISEKKIYFSSLISSAQVLCVREWQRVIREPSRILGMLLQPLIFLAVFGIGFHQNFYYLDGSVSYGLFFFPGILGLVVLFASIYATVTLVDDKKCGLFRLVIISPAGVAGALIGKILATAMLGFSQSLLFLVFIFILNIKISFINLLLLIFYLFLGAFLFALMGVCLAWVCSSSAGFHALMSIFLIPMWLLSGAMFPIENNIFKYLSYVNPMSYFVAGVRAVILSQHISYTNNLFILFLFILFFCFLLFLMVKKKPVE